MTRLMTHSPADVLRYLLIGHSLGSLPTDDEAWPIYVGQQPDTPDSVITCTDTAGIITHRLQPTGERPEHYGAQVRVRAAARATAYTKVETIAITLDEVVSYDTVTIGSTSYTVASVVRQGGIMAMGKESPTSKRNQFSLNVIMAIRQTS